MKRILSFIVLAFVLSSCHYFGGHRVIGDGNITTQTRAVSDFKSVDVSGNIDVLITQDSSYTVKVEADNNLQEFINVYRDGNVLRIHPENHVNLDPSKSIKVYVSAPVYESLEASGACSIVSQSRINSAGTINIGLSGACDISLDVKSPATRIDASGACTVTLKGETKDFSVEGSGDTNIKAFELLSENADVDLSGAGSAEIFASVKLKASSSGATDIRYKGNPAVSTDMSGAGSVKKVE